METNISIIVPVFNAENYLFRCLCSLISQTYGFIEIICINDGSTDHSAEILERFARLDSRIKVIYQGNLGPAAARNKGLEAATGKYVMFCDADDSYEHDMCEKMFNAMLIHNVDLVMCDCRVNTTPYANFRQENDILYHRLKLTGYNFIDSKIYNSVNVVLWNKILKMSLIKKYDIKFPDGYEHDDACFILKYLAVSTLYYGLDEVLYNYNICNPESLMAKVYKRNNYGKKLDFLYAYYDVLQFILKNPVRKEIAEGFKHMYVNQINHFSQFLNNREQAAMLAILHGQLKNIEFFENNKLINSIKEGNLKKARIYLNRKSKMTFWQQIFSLKNKSDRIKMLTVLGVGIPLPRKSSRAGLYKVNYTNKVCKCSNDARQVLKC